MRALRQARDARLDYLPALLGDFYGRELMSRDDIICMAHQAGLFDDDQEPLPEYLEHFAALVAAAALEQPEQEPVAYRFQSPATEEWLLGLEPPVGSRWAIEPLYTNPPRREWQGLTD